METAKKTTVTLMILIFVGSALLFGLNSQRIWETDDPIIEDIRTLYILEGRAMPSTTGPWSEAELRIMFSKLSPNTYPVLYGQVQTALQSNNSKDTDSVFRMNLEEDLALACFAHSDTDFEFPYNDEQNYISRMGRDMAMLYINWETWAGDSIYTFSQFGFKNYDNAGGKSFDSYHFNSNLAFLTPSGVTFSIDFDQPYRAFISFGSDYWNIELGRDRLVIGYGETGSLIISDTIRYHNLFKFSMFGERYKYSFIMSFLPHPINTGWYNEHVSHSDQTNTKGIFFYMTHVFESRLFSDKLSLALTESIVYQSEEGTLEFRFISPFALFHNFWVKRNANSILTLEISYALCRSIVTYGQICLDDYATKEEREIGDTTPNAVGYMIGIRTNLVIGQGILKSSAELVYTDPYLYLRSVEWGDQGENEYGLGYIAYMVRRDSTTRKFLGYTYGGDAIVGNLKVEYVTANRVTFGGKLFVMLHGEKNIASLYHCVNTERTPTGNGTLTVNTEFFFRYVFKKNASLFGQLDYVKVGNQKDLQLMAGIRKVF